MNEEKIKEAAYQYLSRVVSASDIAVHLEITGILRSFIAGAKFALTHQWIDAKVELPPVNRRILAAAINKHGQVKYIDVAWYNGTDFLAWHNNEVIAVTHWMPMLDDEYSNEVKNW